MGVVLAMSGMISLAISARAGIVEGTVVLGPLCPGPPRQGQECAAVPIATMIDIFGSAKYPTAADTPIRRAESDIRGHFKVSLEPDTYWFVPRDPHQRPGISFPKPAQVVVTAGTTTVTLVACSSCDQFILTKKPHGDKILSQREPK